MSFISGSNWTAFAPPDAQYLGLVYCLCAQLPKWVVFDMRVSDVS